METWKAIKRGLPFLKVTQELAYFIIRIYIIRHKINTLWHFTAEQARDCASRPAGGGWSYSHGSTRGAAAHSTDTSISCPPAAAPQASALPVHPRAGQG